MDKKVIVIVALVVCIATIGLFATFSLMAKPEPEDKAAATVALAGTLASLEVGRKKVEEAKAEAEKKKNEALASAKKVEAAAEKFEETKESTKKELSEMTLEEKVARANGGES